MRKKKKLTVGPVIGYYDTIEDRRVLSNVEPGYLKKLLPDGPPELGEAWAEIQSDIESKIMPGLTHWWVQLFVMDSAARALISHQAIPQLSCLLPRQFDLPRHPRRALFRCLHICKFQLALLSCGHRARNHRPRLALQAPQPARMFPLNFFHRRWGRHPGLRIGSYRDCCRYSSGPIPQAPLCGC